MSQDEQHGDLDGPGEALTVLSAFEQVPIPLFAMEGPDLRIVALNGSSRFIQPVPIGESPVGSEVARASGLDELLLRVYETGEQLEGYEWRISLPGPDGSLEERYVDFRCTPWRWDDGSIRGVLGHAVDVTGAVRRRKELEESAALWRDRFYSTREVIAQLQSALLPPDVPVLPSVEVAARYLVAGSDQAAGGDWYSALPLPDGRLGLVVGDVVGHGVAACGVMNQLRAVLDQRLRRGDTVAEALKELDEFSGHVRAADSATVCVAALDRGSGALEYCTAGHPAPLLVSRDDWRYLEPTGSGPLGSGRGFATATTVVPPGGMVVLYSDGLLERPGVPRSASTIEIGRTIANALSHPWGTAPGGLPQSAVETVCEQSLDYLTRLSGYDDDITMLAIRRVTATPPLNSSAPADDYAILRLLSDLEEWLWSIGAGAEDVRNLRHAVVELVTNCVEHAGGDDRQPDLVLEGELDERGVATIVVRDFGTWKPNTDQFDPVPEPTGARLRGLGLAMTRQLVDALTVDHDPSGTTAVVSRRLRRPAGTSTTASSAGRWPAALGDPLTADRPEGGRVLHFAGPVIYRTAGLFGDILDIESRAGTRDLTVDLSGLTHLASAGVLVLHQLVRQATENQTRLTLLASPGSVADQVLHLVGIASQAPPQD